MGSQLSSCSNEIGSYKTENLCTRSGCSNLCMDRKDPKALMKTMTLTVDGGHAPAPEKYAPHGAEEKSFQNAFFGLFTHEKVFNGEGTAHHESLPRQPRGSDLENIGPRKSMGELQDECRYNAGKLQKIKQLASKYQGWRPVRGDGNCFYRTVIFGTIEAMLAAGDHQRMQQLIAMLREEVVYALHPEQAAHAQLVQIMETWELPEQVEQWVAQDAKLDEALVRASRQLARIFLLQRAHDPTPSGLTYEQLACALDPSNTSIEDFCQSVVDPLGRDAETLALDALPQQLGIGLRMWILDRRDEVDLVSLDTPGPGGEIDIHVLFKPGHYDLLYPAAEATSSAKAVLSEEDCTTRKALKGDLLNPSKAALSEDRESSFPWNAMEGDSSEAAKTILTEESCTARKAMEDGLLSPGLLSPSDAVLPRESRASEKATEAELSYAPQAVLSKESCTARDDVEGDLLDPVKAVMSEESCTSRKAMEGDSLYAVATVLSKEICAARKAMKSAPTSTGVSDLLCAPGAIICEESFTSSLEVQKGSLPSAPEAHFSEESCTPTQATEGDLHGAAKARKSMEGGRWPLEVDRSAATLLRS